MALSIGLSERHSLVIIFQSVYQCMSEVESPLVFDMHDTRIYQDLPGSIQAANNRSPWMAVIRGKKQVLKNSPSRSSSDDSHGVGSGPCSIYRSPLYVSVPSSILFGCLRE